MLTFLGVLGLLWAIGMAIYLVCRKKREEKAKVPPPTVDQKADAEIRDKEAKLRECRRKIDGLVQQQESLDRDIGRASHEVARWDEVANAARKDEDIREAVRLKLQAKQKQALLESERQSVKEVVDDLKEQIRLADDKVQFSKAKAAELKTKLAAAKIREEVAGGVESTLSDLEEEALKAESQAQAKEEISDFSQQFAKKNVVDPGDIEDEVRRLKESRK